MDLKKEMDRKYKKYLEKVENHRKEMEKRPGFVLDDKSLEFIGELYNKMSETIEKK